jgi:hypothetical protein
LAEAIVYHVQQGNNDYVDQLVEWAYEEGCPWAV